MAMYYHDMYNEQMLNRAMCQEPDRSAMVRGDQLSADGYTNEKFHDVADTASNDNERQV